MHNNWPYCPDVIAFIAFLLIAKSIPWSLLPIWLSHSLIVPLLNYVTDGSLCYCNFLFFFSLFPVSLLFKIHYSPLQALPSPSLFSFFFFSFCFYLWLLFCFSILPFKYVSKALWWASYFSLLRSTKVFQVVENVSCNHTTSIWILVLPLTGFMAWAFLTTLMHLILLSEKWHK